MSSRTTVSPYPARTSRRLSASATMLFAEINLMHPPVLCDLLRRPLDQHLALHHDGDALREAKHEVHVVLDDQDGNVLGQIVEHPQDAMRFQRGDARRRLVEEQNAR